MRLSIRWPDVEGSEDVFEAVEPGRYRVAFRGAGDPSKSGETGPRSELVPYPLGL